MRGRWILFLAILLFPWPIPVFAAPPQTRSNTMHCFPETGACIEAPFLGYWLANGAASLNGLPLADAGFEVLEDGQLHLVQYFEHVRLEIHWDNPTPDHILLGQFGRLLHPAEPPATALPGASYFVETGHNVAPDFIAFWQTNGGIAQFGYPLTDEFTERLEDGNEYTVQYFERARFERHPKEEVSNRIQLGQLGRAVYQRSLLAPRNLPPTCHPAELAVSMNRGAGLGTTYIDIRLRNQGDTPCSLSGFLHPELLDVDGQVLPSTHGFATAFNGPQAQSPFVLTSGQTARGMITWVNNCAEGVLFDPLPAAALRLALPNGEGTWTFQTEGPRCGSTGEPKGINVAALSLIFDEGPTYPSESILETYFSAISHGSYRSAFDQLSPELQIEFGPYERFAAGFATTKFVTLAIAQVQAIDSQTIRFSVRLAARQFDGTARYYIGSYDVYVFPNPVKITLTGRIVAANVIEEFP